MSIDFECPHCLVEVDSGDIPDHVSGAHSNNGVFNYECSCGCKFDVFVDYYPSFEVDEHTIKLPPGDALQKIAADLEADIAEALTHEQSGSK